MFFSCEIVSTLLTKVVSFCSYHELITQRLGASLSRSHFLPTQQVIGQSNPAERSGITRQKSYEPS